MAAGYIETLKQHSRDVAKLEGAQADEFLRLLKALQEEMTTRLAANPSQSVDAFSIQRIIAETQAGIDTLERRGVSGYVVGSKEAVEMSLDQIAIEIGQLSKAFDAQKITVSLDAAKALADPAQGLLANHFQTSLQRYGADILNNVRQELFVGMRAGETVGDIASRVASKNGPLGEVAQSNATRLVRTEMSQAFGSASHSGLMQAQKQVKGLEKTWIHIGSYRCDVCMPLHGTQRPIDGTWTIKNGKKTREVAHPPGHPNCACRVNGMKKSWREGLEKLGYLDQNPIDPKSKPTSL